MKAATLFFMVLFFVIVSSCSQKNNELCRINDLKKAITLPEQYKFIECEPDIYEISIHLKLDINDIESFLDKNKKFQIYQETDEGIHSPQNMFLSDLKGYFNHKNYPEVENTYYYETNDNKKNYLSCLLTKEGDLFIVFEKGTLPADWTK